MAAREFRIGENVSLAGLNSDDGRGRSSGSCLTCSIGTAFRLTDLTGVGGRIRKESFRELFPLRVLCIDGEFVSDGTGISTTFGLPTDRMQMATANLTADSTTINSACSISSEDSPFSSGDKASSEDIYLSLNIAGL